ncbi:hypothetical protein [Nocardiopsis protaetiae]|uniref:hypothetical protein n=1 Tax=Nocardiopsis protaetiae TaxID=3382270 RepID=UPI00387AC50C
MLSVSGVVLSSLMVASSLHAEAAAESLPSQVGDWAVLESVAPEVTEDLHRHLLVESDRVVAPLAEGESSVPMDADEPITVGGYGGLSVDIEISGPEEGGAEVAADGVVVFDHGSDARTIPLLKSDGSVQITTVIDGPASPVRYGYEISAVGLERIEEIEGGVLVLYGGSDEYLGSIAPAWAKDASGKDVPTWYEIDGASVTQMVDHSSRDVDYPIVADPWLGIDLFSWTSYDTYNGQLRVNARKSVYGQGIHAPGTGQAIFLTAGWNELKAKRSRVTEKKSLRQQYDCHVAGGFFNIAGDWNLEKFRPTRTRSWTYGVARHRCNWTTANNL